MSTGHTEPPTFEFDVILTGIDDLTDDMANALYEAGCDDSLPGVSCGTPVVTFCRAAPTARTAVLSAIADIRKADIGAEIVRVVWAGDDAEPPDIADINEVLAAVGAGA